MRHVFTVSFKMLRNPRFHFAVVQAGIIFHLTHVALGAGGVDSIESFVALGGTFFTAMTHITARD